MKNFISNTTLTNLLQASKDDGNSVYNETLSRAANLDGMVLIIGLDYDQNNTGNVTITDFYKEETFLTLTAFQLEMVQQFMESEIEVLDKEQEKENELIEDLKLNINQMQYADVL